MVGGKPPRLAPQIQTLVTQDTFISPSSKERSVQGLRQQTWLRRSLLKPFWDAFAACIEAEQKRREALLDWRMERMDSWLDSLE